MSTSVQHERPKNPRKSLLISLVVMLSIATGIGVATAMTPGYGLGTGALIGGIILVCGAFPAWYIYNLRMKQLKEWEE